MSAETSLRALLAGHAAVAAITTRIAINAIAGGAAPPYIVFTGAHDLSYGLDGTLLTDQVSFDVQCWADTAARAEQLADAVQVAIGTAPTAAGATVTGRTGGYDDETGLDAVILQVEWWV